MVKALTIDKRFDKIDTQLDKIAGAMNKGIGRIDKALGTKADIQRILVVLHEIAKGKK